MFHKFLIVILLLLTIFELEANVNTDSLITAINSQKGIDKAKSLLELSSTLLNNDPQLSEKYCRNALKISIESDDNAIKAEALKSLGKVFYFKGNYDSSLVYFKKAQQEFENLKDNEAVASCVNNIGVIYKIWGKYSEALENFNNCIEVYKNTGNKKGIASTLQNIGIIYLNWSNYEKAIENYQNALKIKEELNDEPGIANSLNNIGEVYVMWSNFGKALENYHKSLEIRLKIDDKPGVSISYHNIGEVYKLIGDNIQAIDFYKKAINIQKQLNDKSGLASSLNNIGEVYKNKGQFETALNYFNESLNLNEEISLKKGVSVNLNNIGSVYKEQKKYDLALKYYDRSLEIAKDIDLKDRIMNIFKAYADIYSDMGDYEKAYSYYKKSITLKDSIYNYIQFAEITTKYETEKLNREKKIELDKKQQEVEKQRIYTIFFIVGFLIVVIFIILLFIQFRQKKKANVLLAHQKKEITDSIKYASRIQSAVLPPFNYINEVLKEYFIVNLPRDIVSGDFYWINRRGGITFIAAADCTGHGVPGAFMSMLGITFLNDIVNSKNITETGLILDELKTAVIKSLHQTGVNYENDTNSFLSLKDGMDISLIAINTQAQKSQNKNEEHYDVQWSGANNPLWIIKSQKFLKQEGNAEELSAFSFQLDELKPDKMPIGFSDYSHKFKTNKFELYKGDVIYLFTDGFADQFGGKEGKKYKYNNFRQFLVNMSESNLKEQESLLIDEINNWKRNYDQVDDILIIGAKI